ncbi:hypothetical protein [Flavivirga eckloniae]|uniref:Uncharacterized protein n=1 Tax=Flavivirga eckloniae TaxID=1803846 RepID=A0A2K9PME9_9FLAO|nr:hypothetical protein [Flavivirga eckloniae]AUP78232.1 hypothetical protein C1H87_05660 [Flavivirga eckloniae]
MKVYTHPDNLITPPFSTIATLIMLLDKSGLTDAVKKHCKTGLKVVPIIYNNPEHDTRKDILSRKKYDAFFALFPDSYFNDRTLITTKIIIENVELFIKTNSVATVVCKEQKASAQLF